jgi:hypothetical protein
MCVTASVPTATGIPASSGPRTDQVKRDDYTSRIEMLLEAHGITDFRYERGGKHPRIVISHAGRSIRVGFPATSRNWNSRHVVATRLRHGLGLVGRAGAR